MPVISVKLTIFNIVGAQNSQSYLKKSLAGRGSRKQLVGLEAKISLDNVSRDIVSKCVITETNWVSTYKCCNADFTGLARDKELILSLISVFFGKNNFVKCTIKGRAAN